MVLKSNPKLEKEQKLLVPNFGTAGSSGVLWRQATNEIPDTIPRKWPRQSGPRRELISRRTNSCPFRATAMHWKTETSAKSMIIRVESTWFKASLIC